MARERVFEKYGGIKAWAVTGVDQGSTSTATQRKFAQSILDKRGYRMKTIIAGAALPFLGVAALAADAALLGNEGGHLITNTSPDAFTGIDAALACGVNLGTLFFAGYAPYSAVKWGKSIFETRGNAKQAAREDANANNTLVKKYLRASHWATIDMSLTLGFLGLGALANAFPVLGQFAGPVIAFGGGTVTGLVIDLFQAGAKKHMYDDARSYVGKRR